MTIAPKRRRFTYSLRTMLVLIFAFCVLMSQYPFTERLGHEVLVQGINSGRYETHYAYFPTERFVYLATVEAALGLLWFFVVRRRIAENQK
jgi:hypothetical protein